MTTIGELGEILVLEYLKKQGWQILHHRWHCRWGEIDLIVHNNNSLSGEKSSHQGTVAFVEVKTRSFGNWDAGGMLSVDHKKQAKLIKTATSFITKNPDLADFDCRFDVALVRYSKYQPILHNQEHQEIILGKPVFWQGYKLTLHQYVESAFEGFDCI